MKSTPSNLSTCRILGKKQTKMSKFGAKNASFGYLLSYIVIFEISTLEFAKNESLTHTVTFGIGFAFSESLGSAFSESPGPGLGPLYKVYLDLMIRNTPLPPSNLEYH